MKKVFATLRALVEVMESLSKDVVPEGVGRLILDEVLSAFLMFLARAASTFFFSVHCISFYCSFPIYLLIFSQD